jgi:hypothetical protein
MLSIVRGVPPMKVRMLVFSNVMLLGIFSLAQAQETPTATPTAVPVTAVPTSPSGSGVRSLSTSLPSSGSVRPKLQPQSVTISLIDGMKLTGELTEVDQWSMKTSFGTTNLPLSTVAGIRMAHEGNAVTTVVLHNGDAITGAIQLDLVVIQTDWGRAEILGNHIASILFTPGLKWMSEAGLNGTRWKLVSDTPAPPGAAAGQPGARPGVPGQPQPGQPQPGQPRPGFQPGFQPGVR